MTDRKIDLITTQPESEEITITDSEEQIRKLEVQVLHFRKLHASALQMLVTVGRDILKNQQLLLEAVADMRQKYEVVAEFIQNNAAHLPDPPASDNNAS